MARIDRQKLIDEAAKPKPVVESVKVVEEVEEVVPEVVKLEVKKRKEPKLAPDSEK
jgi:hypothetical protein